MTLLLLVSSLFSTFTVAKHILIDVGDGEGAEEVSIDDDANDYAFPPPPSFPGGGTLPGDYQLFPPGGGIYIC